MDRNLEEQPGSPSPHEELEASGARRIRWIILPISALLCSGHAILGIYISDVYRTSVTRTLVAPFAFGVLFLFVLVVNPLLRRIRLTSPLNRAELMAVAFAMLVTASIQQSALTDTLVPFVSAPMNPEWNTPQRGWSEHVVPRLNRALYIDNPEQIQKFNHGWGPVKIERHGQTVELYKPPNHAPWRQHVEYGFALFREIPWSLWIRPLSYWFIFVAACLGMFYFLSMTLIHYWATREKLIFPLVQLPGSLIGESDEPEHKIPRIFRSGLFWLGFGIVFAWFTWNSAALLNQTGGLPRLQDGLHASQIQKLLEHTIFEGLTGHGSFFGLSFEFTFIGIGIAFLIPLEISFSIWFYYVVAKVMMLFAVWMGFGQTMSDFPTDPLWTNNAISAQGGGAILLFSAVCLCRCIKAFIVRSTGLPIKDKFRIMMPVIGLVVCIATVVAWLCWNHLPLVWAMVLIITVLLLFLGLLRLTAEGGMFGYALFFHTGFFHLFKVFGLGKFVSPLLIAPMLPICAVLFTQYGSSIAPNLLNAEKGRRSVRAHAKTFHANMCTCLVITVVVAITLSIFMSYFQGAQAKHPWFWSRIPQHVLDSATELATSEPVVEISNASWYCVGAIWTTATIILRRIFFWFPHPIGYVMLVNPGVTALWTSFFVSWICKKIVIKYGGKQTYDRVRHFFIGLVMGNMIVICIFMILGVIVGKNLGVS